MQAISPALTTACSAAGQAVCLAVEVSWSATGSILDVRGATGWTDETAYLIRHAGELRISPPGERLVMAGAVGQATVVLSNTTGRFSWKRTDSALTTYINTALGLSGKPIRLYAGYITASGAEYVRVFTGVITGWYEGPDFTVTLYCKDWGERYLQDKQSTAVVRDKRADEWIEVVAGLSDIVPAAMDLDIGIYQIPWCWADDESITEEIWEAAEAEAGLAWFNQNGLLLYRNSLSWINLSSVWTFAPGVYGVPEPEISTDAVATKVRVEWSGRLAGPDTTIYTLDTNKVLLPGQTISWTARFNHVALSLSTPSAADPYNDYYAVTGGGLDITSSLTVTLSDVFGQQCTVTVTNGSTTHTARLTVFKLRGQPLLGGPTEQVEVATSAPYDYERLRSERGNMYCQTAEQGLAVANVLALRGNRVRPIYMLSEVPGIPHLELGDLVTFQEPYSQSADTTGLIVGIGWEAGEGAGYVQQYRLLDLTGWISYTNYFVIGASKLGGPFTELDPETDYGRLFY